MLCFAISGVAQAPPGSGNTLNFSGSNQFVELNSTFGNLTFPVTLTTWYMQGNNQSGIVRFFSSHDMTGAYRGFLFQYISGQINLQCGNGTSRSPSGRWGLVASYSFNVGEWYHIAVVMSSATSGQIYVNGNPVNTILGNGTGTRTLVTDNSAGRLAANTAGNNITYLSGHLEEFTFWDKALTQAEIRDMMCHKLTGSENGLLAYYRFDDGSGNTLTNLVNGGPDGTLRNGPVWVASSAPVGDRSFHNDHNNTVDARGVSLSGDSITIHPTITGTAGTHLYIIDTKPISTAGISPATSIDYYFGVFNAEYSKVYDLFVKPSPATTANYANNTLQVASRPHNASPQWTPTNMRNGPNFSLPGETPMSQYVIALDDCPPVDLLPDDSTACDSMYLDLTGYINYQWSNGTTSGINAVFNSGQVWVSVENPTDGCVYTDTMDITIINSSNLPSFSLDTVVCGANSLIYDISTNGASSYQWYDGTTQPLRTFTQNGSYWYRIFFPGGCSLEDTLNVKFVTIDPDPIDQDVFFLCDDDTVNVQLPPNNYPTIQWSNGTSGSQSRYWLPGNEWVHMQTVDGCWLSDTFEIALQTPLSDTTFFGDQSFCVGESVTIIPPAGINATWPDGETGSYTVHTTQNIRVEITDGCTKSVEYFKVSEYSCECDLKFPNAFTPDGDGLNDYFGPVTKCEFLDFHLIVLNRWGQMIFESRDKNRLFDGHYKNQEIPIGVYVYKFSYRTPYKKGTARGHVTVVR